MAAPKRSKAQREKDLEIIAGLYLRGWTLRRIGEHIGVSHVQVHNDLKSLQKRWRDAALVDFDAARAKELARIDELERAYWDEWERSRRERTVNKTRKSAKDAPARIGEAEIATIRTADHTEIVEERLGDPRYLSGVQWCIEQRIKLLGLAAPIKSQTEITGKGGGPVQVEGKGSGLALAYYEMPAEQWERVNSILLESDNLSGAVRVGGGQTSEAE